MTWQAHKAVFRNPLRLAGWSFAGALLLLPAVAMQFTREVHWTVGDFLFAATMFAVVGLGIELAVRATRNGSYRGGAAVALLTGFLVVWINGAVGIIGTEDHPANLMFFGVLAIAILGSFMARFQSPGMARTMTLAGLAQLAVPVIAIAIWSPPMTVDLVRTLIFDGGLAGLWLLAGWLFRRAAETGERHINVN